MEQIVIRQIRYYGSNDGKNWPNYQNYSFDGNIISQLIEQDDLKKIDESLQPVIKQIEFISVPGASLTLNYSDNKTTTVQIGPTGKYFLNFQDYEIEGATDVNINGGLINYINNGQHYLILNLVLGNVKSGSAHNPLIWSQLANKTWGQLEDYQWNTLWKVV